MLVKISVEFETCHTSRRDHIVTLNTLPFLRIIETAVCVKLIDTSYLLLLLK